METTRDSISHKNDDLRAGLFLAVISDTLESTVSLTDLFCAPIRWNASVILAGQAALAVTVGDARVALRLPACDARREAAVAKRSQDAVDLGGR